MNKASINGFLVVDKPIGFTSAKVVNFLKKRMNVKKIGHGGTLDPLASGVLPIAIGEATKTLDYIVSQKKVYTFDITFGSSTTTDDLEGEVIARSTYLPKEEEILGILKEFIGDILQTPPKYSAIKVFGRRAYDMARNGEEVELEPRLVKVYSLKLLSYKEGKARLIAETGKGVYVRSLGRDIANKLGSCGHISYLRRNSVGNFKESSSLILENVYNDANIEFSEFIIPMKTALDDVLGLNISSDEAKDIRLGRKFVRESVKDGTNGFSMYSGNVCIWNSDELVAVARCDDGKVLVKRVFMYDN